MRQLHSAQEAIVGSERDASFVVRVVHLDGFGGRRAGEALLATPSDTHGSVLSGSVDEPILAAVAELRSTESLLCVRTIPVGDREAIDAGLACGGRAELVIQRLSTIPSDAWTAIASRTPFQLASLLNESGSTLVRFAESVSGSLGNSLLDERVRIDSPELFRKGAHAVVLETEADRIFIEHIAPEPVIAVLGLANLSDAIAHQAALLGWTVSVFDDRVAEQVSTCISTTSSLGPLDGVVVLSHDIAASCAVLAAALHGACGYAGALGSRHTQQARAYQLQSAHNISADQLARVHGPVGLDIGARTPEETALAIVAEALAAQRSRSAQSLRAGSGAING